MKFFSFGFEDAVQWHIDSVEMSKTSIVVSHVYNHNCKIIHLFNYQVPLGVLLKNRAKGDDMADIMVHIHQCVPTYQLSRVSLDCPGICPGVQGVSPRDFNVLASYYAWCISYLPSSNILYSLLFTYLFYKVAKYIIISVHSLG